VLDAWHVHGVGEIKPSLSNWPMFAEGEEGEGRFFKVSVLPPLGPTLGFHRETSTSLESTGALLVGC